MLSKATEPTTSMLMGFLYTHRSEQLYCLSFRTATGEEPAFRYKYFPSISFNLSRVFGGIFARSVKIACASAEPQLQVRSLGMAATASLTTLHAFSAFLSNTATI